VLAQQRIQNDNEISRAVSLLADRGSNLEFGEMRVLPVGNSLLYVQPFYIKGEGADSFLLLQGVAVSDGERAVLADTFADALDGLIGASGGPDDPDDPDEPDPDLTAEEYLERADAAFAAADAAAAEGDYEEQGRQLSRARGFVAAALEALGAGTDPDGSADDDAGGEATPTTTAAPTTVAGVTTTTMTDA
jgi:uncharacterized membrane protein (UPF0182 family)